MEEDLVVRFPTITDNSLSDVCFPWESPIANQVNITFAVRDSFHGLVHGKIYYANSSMLVSDSPHSKISANLFSDVSREML